MKINSVAVVIAVLLMISVLPIYNELAQAYDPRAEVPGATITGIILDASGHNVPNATVQLLKDGQLFDIPGNPQQSNEITGPYASTGRYQFMRLPYGQFLIMAEIPDAAGIVHRTNLSVNVNENTMTADIVIPDLVIATTSTPGPSPSTAPSPSAGAVPASSSIFSAGLALPILGICVLLISRRKSK